MMKKNYIIWGISDTGYKESISSSFENNALPSKFKAAVSDKHRTIANYFSQENSDNDYFYSIESLDNEVLYTIYRTNWYRGSRLSFDAATIIVNKNQIIENSLHSLKLLIKSYITQKESGVGEFNFENVISQIKLRAKQSNEKRSISRKYKEGYIKYQSEADLNSIFADSKNQLHNFNKVFFFTRLTYLEEGASKLQNLDNYKEITIGLINYDVSYYRIEVENETKMVINNAFDAYEGDEIKIYKSTGNTPQKVEVAKAGLSIKLNKITPPKPPRGSSSQNNKNKKNKEKIAIIGLCSLLVLLILGFVYIDNILNIFNGKGTNVNVNGNGNGNNNTCKIELVDGQFKKKDGKKITDPSELLECFKDENGFIEIDDNIRYKLTDLTIQESKPNKKFMNFNRIEGLNNLKKKLRKKDIDSVSKQVVNEIQKIINLQRLESESGLKGTNYTWQWKDNTLYDMHTTTTSFSESISYIKDVDKVKDLLKFLNVPLKPIPTSVLEDIKEYIKKNGSDKVKTYLKTLEEEEEEEEEEEDLDEEEEKKKKKKEDKEREERRERKRIQNERDNKPCELKHINDNIRQLEWDIEDLQTKKEDAVSEEDQSQYVKEIKNLCNDRNEWIKKIKNGGNINRCDKCKSRMKMLSNIECN